MPLTARQFAVQALSKEATTCNHAATASSTDPHLPEMFGTLVFNDVIQRQRLSKLVYKALRRTIVAGAELDSSMADAVATAMRDWAIEHGATHFTHWFQPMTGLTAEKHDSFLQPTGDGRAILEFSGKELIKGEPDASSFPSGGIRATFEARGYTAWDPTSPAFLRVTEHGATLAIPTAFCAWTGEALDKKTPLMRSCQALDTQAVRLLKLLGDTQVSRAIATVGSEQEYFLIDRRLHNLRPDLLTCGRTLIGAKPPKGQELEDHYFGAISERVLAYMQDLERELWKLGIPVKTRHNEVAPHQYEVAPIFEPVSLSTDHNMLTMEIMQKVAERHGLACLLHEKPFAGVNGSGKHNNWSMADDLGNNLLDPGHTPHENMKFMVFLTAVIRAVDLHQDLLRAAVAHAGNDHRLGANEAPPAIISVYVGSQLEEIISALVEGRAPKTGGDKSQLRLGVNTLPPLPRDTSDRNRTSPFAFTGNKFEFRAVGASQSIGYPNIVLNTAVTESLDYMANEIEKRSGKGDRREVIQNLVRETLAAHRRIIFNGDNYSEEWVQEAERRGLYNLKDSPSALKHWASEKNLALFEKYGVASRRESLARSNVMFHTYVHRVVVESHALRGLAATMVLPTAITHQERLARSIASVAGVAPKLDVRPQFELLERLAGEINQLKLSLDRLAEMQHGLGHRDVVDEAEYCRDKILSSMIEVRQHCDVLESLVDDDLWPLPKYRELLFLG